VTGSTVGADRIGGTNDGVERGPVPAPRLGSAFRSAASDFYFNSWRLVPANLVWAAGLLLLLLLGGTGNPLLALLLAPLLAFPTFGLFRLAALIQRGNGVSAGDAFATWRTAWPRILALGVGFVMVGVVFLTNMAMGLVRQDVFGVAIATAAVWGAVAMVVVGVILWPLAADPSRSDRPFREIVRLAALLGIAFPLRFGALSLLILVVLAISTVAFVALLTIGIAFIALVSARYVLPAADRLEARTPGG
jgi:uncharacterized membrane protein YesL